MIKGTIRWHGREYEFEANLTATALLILWTSTVWLLAKRGHR